MSKLYNITFLFLICAFHASGQYITVWKTDNDGTSASNQITIPATGTGYSIVWEEVGNPANNGTAIGTNNYVLTFPSPGTYQVSITPGTGTFNRISFASQVDYRKLLEVKQWGNIQWASMENAYLGCYDVKITATDAPDLSNVTSMRGMFSSCSSVSTVPGINNWDVSSVTNMSFMFAAASSFNDPLDNWDVSNVTDMTAMFQSSAFNQPIANWNVGNVTTMYVMFQNAINFNQPIGSWDVRNVDIMSGMFTDAESFNQSLNDWDVSEVTDMDGMFLDATMFNQPLDHWDVGNVETISAMFCRAAAFNQPIGSWDVSNVIYMRSVFNGAASFNQPLNNWNVGNVIDMSEMFSGATVFNQPIGNWNVGQVTSTTHMFRQATAFNQPIGSWDVSKVTNMTFMFGGTNNFNQPLNSWDVSQVTDMSYMFLGARDFNQPLNDWDLSQTTTISVMFYLAQSFNQPVNEWNVSGVTDMSGAFYGAAAFNQPLTDWTISPGANLTALLFDSGMDCVNMTLTLQAWAANTATPDNITFGAQGMTYGSPAVAALETLRNTKNWSIDIGDEVDCEALAVSLISFDAKSVEGTVQLEWATASETDNDYFDVERSPDARSWKTAGRIKGAGTVNSVRYYSMTDSSPLKGISYYRLRIVDFEGKAEYSNMHVVKLNTPAPIVYPNPATSSLTLSGKTDGYVKIYSLSGQEVGQIEVKGEKTIIPIKELPVGPYLLKSNDGWSSKFIKH